MAVEGVLFEQRVGREGRVRVGRQHFGGRLGLHVDAGLVGRAVGGVGVVHEVQVAHLVVRGGADERRPVAARRVERAARHQQVALLDVEDALHGVEGLRPLRVASGDLLQFARLGGVVRCVKIKGKKSISRWFHC